MGHIVEKGPMSFHEAAMTWRVRARAVESYTWPHSRDTGRNAERHVACSRHVTGRSEAQTCSISAIIRTPNQHFGTPQTTRLMYARPQSKKLGLTLASPSNLTDRLVC